MIKCIILAGGLGKRLRSVVSNVPKPMANICGKPFLHYLLEFYSCNFIEVDFFISIGYKKEIIKNYFGTKFHNSNINYVEETSPLGTGGALLRVLNEYKFEFEKNPFLLVNGDSFIEYNINKMWKTHLNNGADITICTMIANESDRYGTIEFNKKTKRVTKFNSKKGNLGDPANGGVYLINPTNFFEKLSIYNQDKFSFESDFLENYIGKLFIQSFETKGYFIDIGIPKDYLKAQHKFAKRLN